MMQTRSSLTLQATEAKSAAKPTRRNSVAAKPKSGMLDSVEGKTMKRKSLPDRPVKEIVVISDDEEDVLSVHSLGSDLDSDFPVRCKKCDTEFSRSSYLQMHLNMVHNVELQLISPMKLTSPKKDEHEKDEIMVEPEKKRKRLLDDSKIQVAKNDDEDYFSCSSSYASDICFMDVDTVDSDGHVESIFGGYETCPHCDETFDLSCSLDMTHKCLMGKLSPEHREIVKNQPFVNLQRLKASKRRRTQPKKLPHSCPLCGINFATNIDMKIHAQMEHRVDPNLMKFAAGSVKTQAKHTDRKSKSVKKTTDLAPKIPDTKLPCQSCSKSFASKAKLDQHVVKVHSKEGKPKKKYDHNNDPLAKALNKRLRFSKGDPKSRVGSLFQVLGLNLQLDPSKWV